SLLEALLKLVPPGKNHYRLMLEQEAESLRKKGDAYVFHEFLAPDNEPCYFGRFCGQLAAKNLRFCAEANGSAMAAFPPPADFAHALSELAKTSIEREQYFDFVQNRTFRQSVICHDSRMPDECIAVSRLSSLHFASSLKPKDVAPHALDDSDTF